MGSAHFIQMTTMLGISLLSLQQESMVTILGGLPVHHFHTLEMGIQLI